MMRSMISYSTLPIGLWMEALKIVIHTSGGQEENPHITIYVCGVVQLPNIERLDFKTIIYHFIGYPDKSKCYRFYCPGRRTKFIETRHVMFLEAEMVRKSMVARETNFDEKWLCTTSMFQIQTVLAKIGHAKHYWSRSCLP